MSRQESRDEHRGKAFIGMIACEQMHFGIMCMCHVSRTRGASQVWERTHTRPDKCVKRGWFFKTMRDAFRGAKTQFFRNKGVSNFSGVAIRVIIFSQNVPFYNSSHVVIRVMFISKCDFYQTNTCLDGETFTGENCAITCLGVIVW